MSVPNSTLFNTNKRRSVDHQKREIFSNLASTEIYDIHPAAVTPTSSISDQTKLPLDSRLATTLNSRYMLKTSTAGWHIGNLLQTAALFTTVLI